MSGICGNLSEIRFIAHMSAHTLARVVRTRLLFMRSNARGARVRVPRRQNAAGSALGWQMDGRLEFATRGLCFATRVDGSRFQPLPRRRITKIQTVTKGIISRCCRPREKVQISIHNKNFLRLP
ncbi:hypothetical protein MTP99_011422 [Tenebrio molitor]|nr:hypothetical protein MTP99_011422 [Tenebrio molitor]